MAEHVTSPRYQLLPLLRDASQEGEFKLSSGEITDWYLDCRKVLGTRWGLRVAVEPLLRMARRLNANVLAGPASASIALMAGAIGVGGNVYEIEKFVYTRQQQKDHGLQEIIEGPSLGASDRVLLVDDVITTGRSLINCAQVLQNAYPDIKIVGAWGLVARNPNKLESCQTLQAQFPIISWQTTQQAIRNLK